MKSCALFKINSQCSFNYPTLNNSWQCTEQYDATRHQAGYSFHVLITRKCQVWEVGVLVLAVRWDWLGWVKGGDGYFGMIKSLLLRMEAWFTEWLNDGSTKNIINICIFSRTRFPPRKFCFGEIVVHVYTSVKLSLNFYRQIGFEWIIQRSIEIWFQDRKLPVGFLTNHTNSSF